MGAQAVRLSNVDIDNALKNKDFEVLFQPIFDLGNGALARVETFVRWRHPKLGLLPPGAFISFFESQGRMGELTRYVLGNALREYTEWRGPWPPGLSVNLALSDLSDDAFTSHFTKLLRDNDFPADLVTLELPMPPVDMPIETAAAHFARIADTGARLAIEVRGRANELLRSLDPFPFDEIKTGGSAILRFARTVRGPGLSAIADLLEVANKANAAITAVGVEDQASLSALRGLGFTAAQGNHLGKVGDLKDFRPHRINEVRSLLGLEPLSADNITALFRTEAPAPQAAEASEDTAPEDALIDRLNERVAQFDNGAQAEATPRDEPAEAGGALTGIEEEKKTLAKEKAKALALAKRAKMRDARKSAAIERAKAKAGHKPAEATDVPEAAVTAPSAARGMQERLNRAFTAEEEPPRPAPAEEGTPVMFTQEELSLPKAPAAKAPPSPPPAAEKTEPKRAADTAAAKPEAKTTVERAVAAEMAAMQKASASKAQAPGGLMAPVSLSVGASGAYFQPGIRVGAAALPGQPDKSIPPAGIAVPAAPKAETPLPKPAAERPLAAPKPPKAEVNLPEPAPERPLAAPPKRPVAKDTGDLHEDETLSASVPPPKRRPKPFLTRTVVPLSKHFWPRSWRRAWARQAAQRSAEAAQAQAAE